MPVPLLTLLIACDAVKPELLDAELDSRDIQIAALEARLATLETTVDAQNQALAAEQAARVADIAALGQSVADGDAALDARVSALDATVGVHGETLISHDAALAALSWRADATDDALTVLDEDLGALQVDVAVLGLGLSAAETRLTLLESADVAGIETRVSALEDARAAAGETWAWFPSSSTESQEIWSCAAAGRAAWQSVGALEFTPIVDGAVLVTGDRVTAGSGGSGGSGSTPEARMVLRDGAGSEVAAQDVGSYTGSQALTWAARVSGGVTYTVSLDVWDDCSALSGGGVLTHVWGTNHGMTVTTL